jgi:hypothetical protein
MTHTIKNLSISEDPFSKGNFFVSFNLHKTLLEKALNPTPVESLRSSVLSNPLDPFKWNSAPIPTFKTDDLNLCNNQKSVLPTLGALAPITSVDIGGKSLQLWSINKKLEELTECINKLNKQL